ncbi:LysR family transcriptional regulator [Rhodanobacter ginsengisoli]|uniref:LysR family transcriptional regulator n=1 Tax=Rhodanobacter ginsengisoli TaxID=418646 RepID=A0ABW0QMS2_9GAMM
MDTKRLDLNLLITLETLLVECSVTKAAYRLHLSQPAVSAQLARLRQVFDDPLLIPAQRGMTPTAKAIELIDPLRQALDQVRGTLAAHRNIDPSTAELTFSVACTDYLQAAVVMPLITELQRRAPKVRVAIRYLDPRELEGQMARGDVDLALMTPHVAPPSLRTRHLFDERYVLIGRTHHPRLRKGMSVKQFAQLDYVVVSLGGGAFETPVDDVLTALGHKRNVVVSAASFLLVPELVAHSDFVALVPERLVHQRQNIEQFECPFPVEGFPIAMVWHERSHGHSGLRWIREVLVAMASERPI